MLSRDIIIKALKKLGGELEKQGLQGEIILTGGASMCLIHSARDMTKDIDALYEPKTIINKISEKIAKEDNLPIDWLNDGVKGFVNEKIETMEFAKFRALKVASVTPEYLLAMKLMSARVTGQDYSDIKFLLNKLNIKTVQEAQNIVEKFYPIKLILPKTMYVIEQSLEEIQEEKKLYENKNERDLER